MRLKVNPNRMELLRLRKRLVLSRRGHDLLKDKQDELMKQFLGLQDEARDLRREVEELLERAYRNFILARGALSPEFLRGALRFPGEKNEIQVTTRRVMNLFVPEFQLERSGSVHNYGFLNTSVDLDISLRLFSQALPHLVRLAEKEKAIEILAEEIEKTRRRVNALEYILIPNLEETIGYITMKLAEMERGTISRLMKVKEMLA